MTSSTSKPRREVVYAVKEITPGGPVLRELVRTGRVAIAVYGFTRARGLDRLTFVRAVHRPRVVHTYRHGETLYEFTRATEADLAEWAARAALNDDL